MLPQNENICDNSNAMTKGVGLTALPASGGGPIWLITFQELFLQDMKSFVNLY